MAAEIVKHVLATSAYYRSLSKKDANTLYFLEDSKEIYRGETPYTASVVFVQDFPEFAAVGKVYVNTTNLECKSWNGSKWEVISPQVINTLDESEQNGIASASAVKTYVTNKIREIITEGGAVSDTDKVTLTSEITVKGQTLGSYKDGDKIRVGTTLTEILKKQFAKQIPPTYSKPSIKMTPASQAVESGTKVKPNIVTAFTKADAGEVNQYTLTRTLKGESITLVDKSPTLVAHQAEEVMVPDGGNLQYKAAVGHDEGQIKNDNLGDQYPNGHIVAGTLNAAITYTGQRKAFFGKDQQSVAVASSDEVRALPLNKLNPTNGVKLSIPIAVGDTRITFAYPSSLRDVSNVLSKALNLDVKETFVKSTIEVEGANGYDPIQYKVYTYIPAVAFSSADTYEITI